MKITNVQIELAESADRLRAFCRLVFDDAFVVNDIRLLEGPQGFFVAMPSRRITRPCPSCSEKNHLAANYCNACGKALQKFPRPAGGGGKAFADIAHPINAEFRGVIHDTIVEAYLAEIARLPAGTRSTKPLLVDPSISNPNPRLDERSA